MTTEAVANAVGVSKRTVYRDLEVLASAGHIIESRRVDGRVLRWIDSARVGPLRLDAYEREALRLARELLTPLDGTQLVRSLERLLEAAPASAESLVSKHRPRQSDPRTATTIERAIEQRATVALEYVGRGGDVSQRQLEPHRLEMVNGQAYLHAFDLERDGFRTFKLARVRRPRLELRTFQRRELPPRSAQSVGVWEGPVQEVRILLAVEVAALVHEYPLVPGQRVQNRADGTAEVSAEVAGLVETKRWVLAWGSAAQVLAPVSLRDAVRDELVEALAGYLPGVRGASPPGLDSGEGSGRDSRAVTQRR